MTISSLDQLIAGTKQMVFAAKTAGPTGVAAAWHSLWAQAGVPAAGGGTGGAAPTTAAGTVVDNNTTGTMAFQNPGTPATALIMSGQLVASQPGVFVLYDRCWHWNTSPATTYANIVQSSDVYRPSTGEGVEYWVEVTTALSAAAHTLTMTYTDAAGNAGNTATCVLPASAILGRMFPFVMAAGDYGARRVTAMTGSATPPTGSINIVALRRLATFFVPTANNPVKLTATETGLMPLYDSSALCLMYQAVNTTALTSAVLTAQLSSG